VSDSQRYPVNLCRNNDEVDNRILIAKYERRETRGYSVHCTLRASVHLRGSWHLTFYVEIRKSTKFLIKQRFKEYIVVNRACHFFNGRSLEITLTVFLNSFNFSKGIAPSSFKVHIFQHFTGNRFVKNVFVFFRLLFVPLRIGLWVKLSIGLMQQFFEPGRH